MLHSQKGVDPLFETLKLHFNNNNAANVEAILTKYEDVCSVDLDLSISMEILTPIQFQMNRLYLMFSFSFSVP